VHLRRPEAPDSELCATKRGRWRMFSERGDGGLGIRPSDYSGRKPPPRTPRCHSTNCQGVIEGHAPTKRGRRRPTDQEAPPRPESRWAGKVPYDVPAQNRKTTRLLGGERPQASTTCARSLHRPPASNQGGSLARGRKEIAHSQKGGEGSGVDDLAASTRSPRDQADRRRWGRSPRRYIKGGGNSPPITGRVEKAAQKKTA